MFLIKIMIKNKINKIITTNQNKIMRLILKKEKYLSMNFKKLILILFLKISKSE